MSRFPHLHPPLRSRTTTFAGDEKVFIPGELDFVPASQAARAGFPHDLVETEGGEAVPVRPLDWPKHERLA